MTLNNVVGDYFPRRINQYCPAMGYAADLVMGEINRFSLGTPAAFDIDAILDDAVATDSAQTHTTFLDDEADATYGRTVAAQGTAGSNHVVTVKGRDYLGQPMQENLTLSGTTIIYGWKAFKFIDEVAVAAGAASDTFDLGWSYSVGLPYKVASVPTVQEGTVTLAPKTEVVTFTVEISAAESAAGFSHFVKIPFAGYVKTLRGISHGGGSTNDPAITVELGGNAITGLTVAVDTSAGGDEVTDTPTTAGYNANNRVAAGDLIEIVGATAASAGPITIELDIQPIWVVLPDTTDPATATTDDPRGLYTPVTYAVECIAGMIADNSVNSDGNGGLHGIAHYYA